MKNIIMNFEKQVGDSFLPFTIQLAQEHNINLIFVRTRILGVGPLALEDYTEALDAYLSEQDHVFLISFTHDPRITKEFFIDGLHLNEHGKLEFTKILAGEFKKVLESNR
jgi:hypothetical protein